MLDTASLTLVGRVFSASPVEKSGGWRRNFVRRQ